jgi:2,4-dienoyl-CoA reductase-like NADH-dependent reductase (Old Yellow Enzyme family)/thioredoxin reductase
MTSTQEILAAPLRLGPLKLANRLVIAPHTVNFGFPDGIPDDDIVAYLTRRAPGFALVWVPCAAPDPLGRAEPGVPWLWDDRAVPALARLAEALERAGTVPGLQINHAGRQTEPSLIDGHTPVGPSPIPTRTIYTTIPRELSVSEIARVVEGFAQAARRAAHAGYRAVNLHFAHGYLIHQFLSPDSNARTDAYGGSLGNRMRIAVEIVRATRDAVGPGVALEARLNGSDCVEGGIEVDETIEVARALLAAGLDAVSISGGVYGSSPFTLLLPFDGMPFLPLAARVREATGAIVTGVGNIRRPEEAAAAVVDEVCDLVGVGRAVMADPDWALKALGLARRPVRPCLGTLDGCSERVRLFQPVTCQVMPEVGRERRLVPHSPPRRLAVVGAGPAGCEAAVYAAEHGDDVLLLEAGDVVGGALRLAGVTPGGEPFASLADFYADELARLGVDVRLRTPAAEGTLGAFRPEHVILATGARPDVPMIDGYTDAPLATDEEVLSGQCEPAGRVVVVGAGRRALATALFCADRGVAATVVDHDRLRAGYDASALMRRAYKQQLEIRGVPIVTGPILRMTRSSVVLADAELPVELIVLAARMTSLREAVSLVPAGVSSSLVGDAREPRSVMDAIAEAREAVDQLHTRAAA